MEDSSEKLLEKLKSFISDYDSAVIAFSGGMDSTLLAKISKEVLVNKIALFTIFFTTSSEEDSKELFRDAESLNIEHFSKHINELEIPGFAENSPDRCYSCKKSIFSKILDFAKKNNYSTVFDGSNIDDLDDYRPGLKALNELGVISPFKQLGVSKDQIKKLSSYYNLNISSKPPNACLASRIPYGEEITYKKLKSIHEAENAIKNLGFTQFRVRSHYNLARLEFIASELDKAWSLREELNKICLKQGFLYTAIDCKGYQSGSLNKPLNKNDYFKNIQVQKFFNFQ